MFINRTLISLLLIAAVAVASVRAAEPAASAASPAAAKVAELFPDKVVAKGKGLELKRSQVEDEVTAVKASLAAGGKTLPPEHQAILEQQVFDRMLQIQLLLAKATDADRAKGKELCQKRLDELQTRAGGEEAMVRQFKAIGTTLDNVKKKLADELAAQTVLEREIKVTITEDEVKKFYEDNPSSFEQPEMVRASHVLIGTRDPGTNAELSEDAKKAKHKIAEDVLKRARAGEDFAKLAKEFSEDPGSKDKGGEYTFPRGQMVKEFENTAFSLKTNEVSDIVTTQFGYHIIKLSEKLPAKKTELAKVSSDIKEYLQRQAIQKQLPEYTAKLKAEANVEILDDQFKAKPETDLPAGHPPVTPEKKAETK